MAYNKKDEDDSTVVKVDRTSVFQEGTTRPYTSQVAIGRMTTSTNMLDSTCIQHITRFTTKMSHTPDQDRTAPLHRREVPYE